MPPITLQVAVTSAVLLGGLLYLGKRKPGYSHICHTISELGEVGSPVARPAAYGLFLPVGLLLLAVASLTDQSAISGLAACVGVGYVVAAFFPCDPGSPVSGSVRQQIHNLGGAVEYVGGAYFLSQLSTADSWAGPALFSVEAGLVLVGAGLLSVPGLPLRGFVQRLLEAILFGNLMLATLPK